MGAHFSDIPNIPAREIDHMGTQVAQAAITALSVKAPAVLSSAAIAGDIANMTVKAAPNIPRIDELPHIAILWQPAIREQDHMLASASLSLFVHGPGLLSCERQWLFAQHMQVRGE